MPRPVFPVRFSCCPACLFSVGVVVEWLLADVSAPFFRQCPLGLTRNDGRVALSEVKEGESAQIDIQDVILLQKDR